jgi:hypothetical protein
MEDVLTRLGVMKTMITGDKRRSTCPKREEWGDADPRL